MLKTRTINAIAASRVHRAGHLTRQQRRELAHIFIANRGMGNRPRCRFSTVLGYYIWVI